MQPYGLHDCRINGMEITDGNLKLTFLNEIFQISRPEEPGRDVYGYIVVEGIDPDFCNIIIEGKGGSMGGFRGERLAIPEFTEKYNGFDFEVINEYYGWQKMQLSGWLWSPGACRGTCPKEMTLSLSYFKGDIVYITEE